MAQYSKYIPAPWKLNTADAYGDPSEVFVDRLHEVAAAVGLQNAFFPTAADCDNGSPNLLDWCDHGLWLIYDGHRGATRDYSGSFVYTEGHEANWKPARFSAGSLQVRNVGDTSDLPPGVDPMGCPGGSIDLTGSHGASDSWYGLFFRLKPSTTYTFSFYAKKLSSGTVRMRLGTGNGFFDPSEAQASNLVNTPLDDAALPVGAWTRLAYTFTTDSGGYVVIYLGGWNAWSNGCTLRLAFPQLEEGNAATAWRPSRYWKYHPFPQPLAIDDTINDTNYAAYLTLALPGSAVAVRLVVNPDWPNNGGSAVPRFRRMAAFDPTTNETAVRRPYSDSQWWQYNPAWEWSHLLYGPSLGQEQWGLLRYGSGNSWRVKVTIPGVWVRHKPVGGLLVADSSPVSGPGHRKAVAWRATDIGSNQVRLKFLNVVGGIDFLPKAVCDAGYASHAANGTLYDNTQSPTGSSVWFGVHANLATLSVTLDKSQDLFVDAVGNAQGFCLNFFQSNSYQTPLVVADFLDPPAPGDDGSRFARWGMLVPNAYVGYEICSCGPLASPYWPAWGPAFVTPPGWGNSGGTGEPPVPYHEVALGTRLAERNHLAPVWAARADGVAANRGRLANLYLARNSTFPGNAGDSWLAADGGRYYLAHKSSISGYAETYLLLVKP